MSALLDAAPAADVVVIADVGLDAFPDFRSLARQVPVARPVRAVAWRVPRSAVPDDPAKRPVWLDGVWQDVDDWIEQQRER